MDYRQTHNIAGVNYVILGNCSVLTSGRIAARLAKEVMPALQAAALPEGSDDKSYEEQIFAVIGDLLSGVDTDLVYNCAIELFLHSKVFADDVQISSAEGGKKPKAEFDSHFLRHPQNLFPFLLWIIMQTCGGFFELGKLSPNSQDNQA